MPREMPFRGCLKVVMRGLPFCTPHFLPTQLPALPHSSQDTDLCCS